MTRTPDPTPTAALPMSGIRTLVGRTLGPTRWMDVAQDDVDAFARMTAQQHWIHVDPDRAAAGPFAGPIAPATFVVAMVPGMVAQLLQVTDAALALTHAIDDVRFPATVPVGTALRASADVLTASDVPGGLSVTLAVTVERDAGIEPVGQAVLTVRYYA